MNQETESNLVVVDEYRKRDDSPAVIEQQAGSNPIMAMLAQAVQKGMPVETLQALRAMQKEYEADEARKAFVAALAAFKAEPLSIYKDKHVSFGKEGYKTEYNHATLGNIGAIIGEALSKHGLSYRWATEQNAGQIKVTCTLMHNAGHQESVSLESGADQSGGKNSIQAIGSTVSYLQRYTLLAITGCATQEQDDDGQASGDTGGAMPVDVLNAHLEKIDSAASKKELQAAYLPALCEASELRDQKAQDMLNQAKNERMAKL